MIISGNLIDLHKQSIYPVKMEIQDGKIIDIKQIDQTLAEDQYIMPGFIDAHVHIESSMLVPTEFARLAVVHGTVATVSDPHEIGNVLGVPGVEFMIKNGSSSPFKFYFGAPSCVPATSFETAGAVISPEDVAYLLAKPEIKYLAEMMNWPGVLHQDSEVIAKIALAQQYNKPVDGHAPGLKGKDAANYIAAGISTDHECFTEEEAKDKLAHGMKIIIREGSAAKNFEALVGLIDENADEMMFCSDDKHPDSLVEGHINSLVKRALAKGHSLFKVLKMACLNPVNHYKLDVGLLRVGDPADFIIVDNPDNFEVLRTYINGRTVAENGETKLASKPCQTINQFNCQSVKSTDFEVKNIGNLIQVIEVIDGELVTNRKDLKPTITNDRNVADPARDLLKIAVINRYQNAKPAVAFVKNFGIQEGAIASSVAHDSHNIIVVGTEDEYIAKAVNLIIANKGGICAVNKDDQKNIPLPIAGLMTNQDGYQIARDYTELDQMVKKMGSPLLSPFMSLSFMALLVIPSIKLSDKGLFDGDKFQFIP